MEKRRQSLAQPRRLKMVMQEAFISSCCGLHQHRVAREVWRSASLWFRSYAGAYKFFYGRGTERPHSSWRLNSFCCGNHYGRIILLNLSALINPCPKPDAAPSYLAGLMPDAELRARLLRNKKTAPCGAVFVKDGLLRGLSPPRNDVIRPTSP